MKISQITIEHLKNYLHVYHDEDDDLLKAILVASKGFVRNYTGLDNETLDKYDELSMAIYILSSELYDNRVYTVENDTVNPVIKSILDMHSINLL